MEAIVFSLNAILPIILIVAFGFFLRRSGTIGDSFLNEGNKFCFNYGFCAMMFTTAYKIDNFGDINWQVVLFAVSGIILLSIIGFIYAKIFIPDDKVKAVIHQAFYRSNYATIGLPLAFNLAGQDGLATATLISAFSVPLYNVISVISLTIFEKNKADSHIFLYMLKKMATNPLIIGVASGMVCVAIRPLFRGWRFDSGEIKFLYQAIDHIGSIAPWLSLIVLGGRFKFGSIKTMIKSILQGVVVKNVVAPLICMSFVIFVPHLIGLRSFTSYEYAAFFALFTTPLAVASVAMTEQMGGNGELIGQILVWTTAVSGFTMMIFASVFRALSIL